MVDRPKKDAGREHGRRPYVSDKPHFDQMRMRTDAFVARYGRRPHSEDKKPYFDDIDYPEMEHFFFGWDPPLFPPFDPVFPPDEPVDPWGPPTTWPYWPPPPPIEPTTGCLFWPPRFEPFVLTPGETAWAYFHVYEGDSLVRLVPHGPIELLTTVSELNACRKIGGPRKCLVSIRAKGSLEGYGPNPWQSFIQAAVVAELVSGRSCSAEVLISPCDATVGPEWDSSRNPEIVEPPNSLTIYLVEQKGVPSFTWSLTGNNCSLTYSKTKTRANILTLGSGFCGTANITVTDACGRTTQGAIRSTSGSWQITPFQCDIPGLSDPITEIDLVNWRLFNTKRTVGGIRITQVNRAIDWTNCGGRPVCGECQSLCTNTVYGCSATFGCDECVEPAFNCKLQKYCYSGSIYGCSGLCEDGGPSWYFCYCVVSRLRYEWECP